MSNIIWKDIPIDYFVGKYEISNTGLIKNIKTQKIKLFHAGSTGYRSCSLNDGKISKPIQIHNLVAEAFLEKIPEMEGYKIIVKFKDGNKDNLNATNLEYGYQKSKPKPVIQIINNEPDDDNEYVYGDFIGKKIKVNSNYLISKKGTIYSLKTGKLKAVQNNPSGYSRVNIPTNENPDKKFYVHRLVAETYIPNPNNYSEVNHIDSNRHNNDITNLEWCSHSMNMIHNAQNKEQFRRKVEKYDKDGNLLKSYSSVKEASEEAKLDITSIIHCCAGRRKTGGGFIWKYGN